MSGAQAVLLLATLCVLYIQYRATMGIMLRQLELMTQQLADMRREIHTSAHGDIYDKIFTFYYNAIDNADVMRSIFRANANMSTTEIKEHYILFSIMDLLYLMYLQRNTLDKGLSMTWHAWVNKLFNEPKLTNLYLSVKNEYDPDYITYLERIRAKKEAVL